MTINIMWILMGVPLLLDSECNGHLLSVHLWPLVINHGSP